MTRECTIDGCTRPIESRGLCKAHYKRWLVGDRGEVLARPLRWRKHHGEAENENTSCSVDGCEQDVFSKGYCEAHYARSRRGESGQVLSRPLGKRPRKNLGKCSVDGCKNKAKSAGMCTKHYARTIRNRTGISNAPVDGDSWTDYKQNKCAVPGCDHVSLRASHGLCKNHTQVWKQQLRVAMLVDMLGGKCNRCGGVFNLAAYDFHHIDPKQKRFSIARMLRYDWDDVVEEAKKCELLCSNCHRVEHFGKDIRQYAHKPMAGL